ncbi:MAG: NRDE family protein [Balneolaceae bacterium]
MCLITFAYKKHPSYALILLANRDEFYGRSTRKAQFWVEEGHPDVLAGKDLEAGGTWMGVNKNGRWAALTNYRDLTDLKENPPSRGDLALNFLKSNQSASQYLSSIQNNAHLYNGFNLLIGDKEDILHYSNYSNLTTTITPGIHGVSNALLNTPWPKLEIAKSGLTKSIEQNAIDKNSLFDILMNETKAQETELPETGLTKEMERAISSIFINTKNYGTRCSTLLLIHNSGNIEYVERRYEPNSTIVIEEQSFQL